MHNKVMGFGIVLEVGLNPILITKYIQYIISKSSANSPNMWSATFKRTYLNCLKLLWEPKDKVARSPNHAENENICQETDEKPFTFITELFLFLIFCDTWQILLQYGTSH